MMYGNETNRGKLITIEGPDGSGKSTQARLLAGWLQEQKRAVVLTREPGGTRLSEEIRRILLDPATGGMVPEAEVLLYAAARAQHVAEIIRPALKTGKVVICDRFIDSSIAYQSFGRGVNPAMVWEVNRLATGGLIPDLTVILDIDIKEGMARVACRPAEGAGVTGLDRIEQERVEFHHRVREGYLSLARQDPHRVKLLAAHGQMELIARQIAGLVEELLEVVYN